MLRDDLTAAMTDGVRLIVFGRQGAGKGTQCVRLAERYGVPHISTGDMLRAAAAEGTEFGLRAKEFMDAGQLLPDDIMLGVIEERLGRPDAVGGWLLDGFPRTPGQADGLTALLGDKGADLAVDLDVSEEVVVGRISGRRVCASCGTIYSVAAPPADGRWAHWRSQLSRRCGGPGSGAAVACQVDRAREGWDVANNDDYQRNGDVGEVHEVIGE